MTNSNTVVVLPAFETAPQKNMTLAHQLADTAALMNKKQLGRLVQKKLIYQFALYLFRQVRGGCNMTCAGACITPATGMHMRSVRQGQFCMCTWQDSYTRCSNRRAASMTCELQMLSKSRCHTQKQARAGIHYADSPGVL
jgi:hypothetical protein